MVGRNALDVETGVRIPVPEEIKFWGVVHMKTASILGAISACIEQAPADLVLDPTPTFEINVKHYADAFYKHWMVVLKSEYSQNDLVLGWYHGNYDPENVMIYTENEKKSFDYRSDGWYAYPYRNTKRITERIQTWLTNEKMDYEYRSSQSGK